MFSTQSQAWRPSFDLVQRELFSAVGAQANAWADADNDGDLDILVNNNGQPPQLLRCDRVTPNHWIALNLIGSRSNRDALGTWVKFVAGDLTQYGQSNGGTSYCSSHDKRLFFGLGTRRQVDSIEVSWPSGSVDRFRNIPANQFITVLEERGYKGQG